MAQPHEIRFAIAMPPSTMTRMMAMGVSQARMFDWSAVAPVRNGDVWASTGVQIASAAIPIPMLRAQRALVRRYEAMASPDLSYFRAYSSTAEIGNGTAVSRIIQSILPAPGWRFHRLGGRNVRSDAHLRHLRDDMRKELGAVHEKTSGLRNDMSRSIMETRIWMLLIGGGTLAHALHWL